MRTVLLFCLLLSFQAIAQDKGDLIFIFQKSKYEFVSKQMEQTQLLESFRRHANYTLSFPRDIPVYFCDCGIENAFYQPIGNGGYIKMCYEYINAMFNKLIQKNGKDEAGIKLAASAVLVLYHELGHAIDHQFDLATTGKHEDLADEFALWLLLKHPAAETQKIAYYSILNWYYSAKSLENAIFMGRAKYADTHSPSLERYFTLLSLFCGSNMNRAYQWQLIGDDIFKPYQLPLSRAKRSKDEYENFINDWKRVLGPFLKSNSSSTDTQYAAVDTVVAPSRHYQIHPSQLQNTSTGKVGVALNVTGFGFGQRPPVNDTFNESGRITFQITVDEIGNITGIRTKESTVSEKVVELYKQAVLKMKLVPKSDNVLSTSQGTITFNIKGQ
ncbi:hypothetical protein FHS57_004795 [Runella defluvii]|uniref:TonB C-terminal domain-containing protein n=1 Tax=Runella defluvii TaxID=370973 RepID=A0A7W5ZQA1_9BACT|nr:DUF4344 domain-containing metallopeptidase [Runella defluvii]MBB3840775.1 hypothetical protein [Runella defluvii]